MDRKYVSKDFAAAANFIFPDGNFIVQDDADGNGPFIAKWIDAPFPTEAEIAAALVAISNARADAQRIAAYVAEADPIFFKSKRGETTEAEWLDKIAEIKTRYPKS